MFIINNFQAKQKLTAQTEEWINMINRQVEEEIALYEPQADMVRIICFWSFSWWVVTSYHSREQFWNPSTNF